MAFRNSTAVNLRLTDSVATSGYFNFEKYAGGIIESTAAGTVVWCVGTKAKPVPLRNETGLVSSTLHANHAHVLPEELFGAGFVMGMVPEGQPAINVRINLKS